MQFLELAPKVPVRDAGDPFPLEQANDALGALRSGTAQGALALVVAAA